MKKLFGLFAVLLLVFLIGSCQSKRKAQGPEHDIYVIADSTEYVELEEALEQVFEREIITPQREKLFKLNWTPLKQIDLVRKFKNIVLVAPLDSEGRTSEFIKGILDSASVAKIESGEAVNINKYDLWAENQLVMIISAPTMQNLEYEILRLGDNFVYAFQEAGDERLKESIYTDRYENEKLEAHLLKKYGWIIYCQVDFQVAVDSAEANFVWLRHGVNTNVERWIFIHWTEDAGPEYLNTDSIKAMRSRLTKKFYRTADGHYVALQEEALNSSEVNFNGRYAILTTGLWKTTNEYMGGPFINYTFIDEKTGRFYMLDGSIFAPSKEKRVFIHQMDVLLQSFITEDELTEDRKESLLDELD